MRALKRFLTRLTNLTMGRHYEKRLKEEVETHVALLTEENLRAGLSPVEARRQALLKFGGVEAIKEDYRDQQSLPFLETLLQDTRHALRRLRKNSGIHAYHYVNAGPGNWGDYIDLHAVSCRPAQITAGIESGSALSIGKRAPLLYVGRVQPG